MNLNQNFNLIRQSATVAIADRVLELKASGREIIPLQVGDPDFATPQAVLDVAFKAMQDGLTHYGPSRGYLDLRQAAATTLARDTQGVLFNPETEILVTHGGIHAYYLAIQSVLNPGDEVLIPDPSWPTHANMVKLLHGRVVYVPAPAENGFIPPLKAWEEALTPKTRVIVINYPSNPTGAYPSRDYLYQLHEFAARHHLWIISDEVYKNLYYNEKAVSAGTFPEVKDHTILVNSLSKTYAMTGWRIGYLAAPQQVLDNALKAGQNSITCVAPFVQKAAAFALTDDGVQKAATKMRDTYARRREIVLDIAREFDQSPVKVTAPQGAFYFFLDFRAMGISSVDICEQILEEEGVGLVPGATFGEQGEGFVRMTVAASDADVALGFRKIMDWTQRQ
ncbi:MAG: pyridoxal phosphate-dependent aminotransferase [Chloroflexota bacterium]